MSNVLSKAALYFIMFFKQLTKHLDLWPEKPVQFCLLQWSKISGPVDYFSDGIIFRQCDK